MLILGLLCLSYLLILSQIFPPDFFGFDFTPSRLSGRCSLLPFVSRQATCYLYSPSSLPARFFLYPLSVSAVCGRVCALSQETSTATTRNTTAIYFRQVRSRQLIVLGAGLYFLFALFVKSYDAVLLPRSLSIRQSSAEKLSSPPVIPAPPTYFYPRPASASQNECPDKKTARICRSVGGK